MNLKPLILCLPILGLAACTWVQPTKESSQVTLVKAYNVKDCVKLSTTNVSVNQKVGIITLEDRAVTDEILTVAKNRAAEMGGDSIVAKGPISGGKMSYDIYKCAD